MTHTRLTTMSAILSIASRRQFGRLQYVIRCFGNMHIGIVDAKLICDGRVDGWYSKNCYHWQWF